MGACYSLHRFIGLTKQEADDARQIIEELKTVAWAAPLLLEIKRRGGVTEKNQPMLFELRIAYQLHKAGLKPGYEHLTGVGTSSVDFYLGGPPEFYIEVVSIQASKGVRGATRQQGSFSWGLLSTSNLYSSDANARPGARADAPRTENWLRAAVPLAPGRVRAARGGVQAGARQVQGCSCSPARFWNTAP